MCKKISKKQIRHQVNIIANTLNITDLMGKSAYELSGGEAQKVAIARTLIRKPKIILADEPTRALDETSELNILKIFHSLNKAGVSILIVTHNPEVAEICDKVYTIKEGKIVPHI